MSRKLFGTGAHGGIVGDIQCGLVASRCDPRRCDEVVVQRTPRAVTQFQFSNRLPQMRDIDDVTWPAFMPKPLRSLFDRREMTTVFEGHSYTLAVGDFEDALLTLRIVGFTMTFGKVQTNMEIMRSVLFRRWCYWKLPEPLILTPEQNRHRPCLTF